MSKLQTPEQVDTFSFADVFAGCGGLSLGLSSAGWNGRFAIEKNVDAFDTFNSNLITGGRRTFDWPEWLPKTALLTSALLKEHGDQLKQLKRKVTLLAGGPPCQGFSMAGRRTHSDPRNSLTDDYIRIVQELEPRFLLIENVRGFTLPFKKHGDEKSKTIPYSAQVQKRIEELGYVVYTNLIDLSEYGVPQRRKRFILIAIRLGDPALLKLNERSPFDILSSDRKAFLAAKGLPSQRPVSVKEAIGDLEVAGKSLVHYTGSRANGFKQIQFCETGYTSPFIALMRKRMTKAPDSLRLPKHKAATISQFEKIIGTCVRGRTLSESDRARLGIKKHALTPLEQSLPSATITTLPDDIVHYSEPRILTVRENARIQTFPDWYKFKGKYTTGGSERKNDCPRYTQVGNAVPPLFAEAIGRMLRSLAS